MIASMYLKNMKDSKFLLTKEWCESVLGDTIAGYNGQYKLKIKDAKIELSEQPRHTDGSVSDNPDTLKAYAGCWTSKKIIYINPHAINAYCYICKKDIKNVTDEQPKGHEQNMATSQAKGLGEKLGEKLGERLGEGLGERLGETRSRILDILKKDSFIAIPKIAAIVGVSETAIQNNLAWLKTHGLVHRVGGARGGHWEVIEKLDE